MGNMSIVITRVACTGLFLESEQPFLGFSFASCLINSVFHRNCFTEAGSQPY